MKVFVYIDESGVFDKKHNDWFVFGGIVFFGIEAKNAFERNYRFLEEKIRKAENLLLEKEIKANNISNKSKSKFFRLTRNVDKFGVVVNLSSVYDSCCSDKRSKQRLLDYVLKLGLKNYLCQKFQSNPTLADTISELIITVDNHSIATNGKYNLQESIRQEFVYGTYIRSWNLGLTCVKPILPDIKTIQVHYKDSQKVTLVRTADIVANRLLYLTRSNQLNLVDHNFTLYYPF